MFFEIMETIGYALFRLLLDTIVPGLLRSPVAANWFFAGAIFLAVVMALFRSDVRDVVSPRRGREFCHATQRRSRA